MLNLVSSISFFKEEYPEFVVVLPRNKSSTLNPDQTSYCKVSGRGRRSESRS